MAGTPVRKRRKELQESGMSYVDAHRQAVAEHKERTGKDIAPSSVWMPGAVKHGAHIGHNITQAMETFIECVSQDATCRYIVESPGFYPQLQRWAMCEAKVAVYTTWLDNEENAVDNEKVRYAEGQLSHWMRQAERSADALGLTPASRARMATSFAEMLKFTNERQARETTEEIMTLVSELSGGGDILTSKMSDEEYERMQEYYRTHDK